MNEIIRNLWIGDFPSALNIQQLRKNKIHSVLSIMRGQLKINKSFQHHQIELDDTQDADILSHFFPAIRFIEGKLEKGQGVLVHCQAGISRSPTIVAAYLVYTLNITPDQALEIILKERPFVQPNSNFSHQLDLFHNSQGNISRKDRAIRQFYLERAVHEVMTRGDTTCLSTNMSSTTFKTTPTTLRQRRIRCKMCRQELATREHLLDHGQLEPSSLSTSPPDTRKPSDCQSQINSSSSNLNSRAITSQQITTGCEGDSAYEISKRLSTMESILPISPDTNDIGDIEALTSQLTEQQLSDATLPTDGSGTGTTVRRLKCPAHLASELYSDPKLAALRIRSPSSSCHPCEHPGPNPTHTQSPLLISPKCSGYFVEPMKWMDHFLSVGSLSGKITCPNKKCNVKLGNYDWAGVCCGCKFWVTPGFCINRSKVDEVV